MIAKIYKICPIGSHEENEVYYGSTQMQYLSSRMALHRTVYRNHKKGIKQQSSCSVWATFDKYGVENCRIELLEQFECENKTEMLVRESYYINNFPCCNIHNPEPWTKEKDKASKKKWYEQNKSNPEYIAKNKISWKKWASKKIECPCGKSYTQCHKLRHNESKHHIKYLELNPLSI